VLGNAGNVSHATADSRAQEEYELFIVRRRALLEAEGEKANLKALEETAKRLPARTKGGPK